MRSRRRGWQITGVPKSQSHKGVDEVTIRPGSAHDATGIRDLALNELGDSPTLPRLRKLLSTYPSFLAFSGPDLCAFVFGDGLAPDIVELANLVVAIPYRHQGLGTQLIKCFETEARERYRAVLVSNSNIWTIKNGPKRSAVPLYRRLGYREIYSTPDTTVLIKEF